jgi:hypothetical protein
MFGNVVLRKTFGSIWNEVTGKCRNLHNEAPHSWYSPNIARVMNEQRMRWTGNVTYMGKKEICVRVW